jgi:hypothetical protein
VGASAFPIFAQKNPDKLDDMLGGIHPAAKTKIEGLQPYNRGKKFRTDPLWKLNKLCTMDKHRLPHVALMLVAPILIAPGGPVPDEMEGVTCAVEDRAPIAFYSAFDHAGAEVNVHLAPALDIAFGQSVPQEVRGMAVPYTLAHIHKYIIEKTLPPLLPFLS